MGRLTDIGLKELEEVLSAWQKQDSLPADVGQCVFPKQLRSVRWAMITENVKNDDTARGEAFISITSDLIKRKWEETSQVTPKSPVAERWSVLLHYVVLQTSAKDTAMALHISLRTLYRRFAEAKPLLLFALRSKDQGLVAGVTYYDEFHDRLKQTDGHLERPKETDAYWALLQGGEERSSSRAVIIEGSPGVGKTSLGLSLARKYQNEKGGTVFWHTFNDSPNSLEDLAVHSSAFFALQGDLRLWHALQLGKKPDDVIHVFLASANGGNSLLCFDNCHQAEGSHVTQTLLTQLCESMCPVILISRETPLLPERLLGRKLGGMTSSQALNVLRRSGIRIAAASSSFRTLYSKTGGNPQLIGLCGRLMTDMPADNWASFLNCMPSRELVWSYIVRNFLNTLDSGERDVISSLVFIFGGKADKQALCISVGTSSAIDSIQRLTRKNVLKELSDGSVETCDILTDLHKQLGPTYFGINSSELRKRHLRVAKNETINGRLISAAEHYVAAHHWNDAISALLAHFEFLQNNTESEFNYLIQAPFFGVLSRFPASRGRIGKRAWSWLCMFRGFDPALEPRIRMHWLRNALVEDANHELAPRAAVELIELCGRSRDLEESLAIFKSINWSRAKDPTAQSYAFTALAHAHQSAGQFEEAATHALKAIEKLTSSEDYHIKALSPAYQTLGKSLEYMTEEHPELWLCILHVYKKRLALIHRFQNRLYRDVYTVLGLIDLGKALYVSGDRKSGISALLESLDKARQLAGAYYLQVWALIALAQVHYWNEDYVGSVEYLSEAIDLSREYSYVDGLDRATAIAREWLGDAEYHLEHNEMNTALRANVTLTKGILLGLLKMSDETERALQESIRLCMEARTSDPSDDNKRYTLEFEAEAEKLLARHYAESEKYDLAGLHAISAITLYIGLGILQPLRELLDICEQTDETDTSTIQ